MDTFLFWNPFIFVFPNKRLGQQSFFHTRIFSTSHIFHHQEHCVTGSTNRVRFHLHSESFFAKKFPFVSVLKIWFKDKFGSETCFSKIIFSEGGHFQWCRRKIYKKAKEKNKAVGVVMEKLNCLKDQEYENAHKNKKSCLSQKTPLEKINRTYLNARVF